MHVLLELQTKSLAVRVSVASTAGSQSAGCSHRPHAPYVGVPHCTPCEEERVQTPSSFDVELSEQLPAAQRGCVTVRERVPVSVQPAGKAHALQAPLVREPQVSPSVSREQGRLSLVVVLAQVAAPHVGVVTLRLCVPVVSQVLENPPQELQAPYITVPHEIPSVSRIHAPFSDVATGSHDDDAQVGVVTLRERMPDSSQVPENPPHALHAPVVTLPHEPPSVSRVHERASLADESVHAPLSQECVSTLRLCEPDSSQVSAYIAHWPHAPNSVAWHSVPSETLPTSTQFGMPPAQVI